MELIVRRKYWLYIILILFASTIHFSSLIMIPALFIVQVRPWSKWMWLIIFGFLLLSFGISRLEPVMTYLMQGTYYEEKFKEALSLQGTNIFRLLVASIPVALAFLSRKKIREIDNPVINICINMAVLTFGTFLISTVMGGNLFGRMAIYFSVFNLITLPWLVINTFNKQSARLVISLCVIFYIAWFYVQMVLGWNLPYTSDILEIYLLN